MTIRDVYPIMKLPYPCDDWRAMSRVTPLYVVERDNECECCTLTLTSFDAIIRMYIRDDMTLDRQRVMVSEYIFEIMGATHDELEMEIMRALYRVRCDNNVPEYDIDAGQFG